MNISKRTVKKSLHHIRLIHRQMLRSSKTEKNLVIPAGKNSTVNLINIPARNLTITTYTPQSLGQVSFTLAREHTHTRKQTSIGME